MLKTTYMPDQQIEVELNLNQLHVEQLRISLQLEIDILSVISGS